MTYREVREAWFDEASELGLADVEQITRLCSELGSDQPFERWDNIQEELEFMIEEMKMEY